MFIPTATAEAGKEAARHLPTVSCAYGKHQYYITICYSMLYYDIISQCVYIILHHDILHKR